MNLAQVLLQGNVARGEITGRSHESVALSRLMANLKALSLRDGARRAAGLDDHQPVLWEHIGPGTRDFTGTRNTVYGKDWNKPPVMLRLVSPAQTREDCCFSSG